MSLLCNGSDSLEIDSADNLGEGASDHLLLSLAHDDLPTSRAAMEAEKRIRREIANSNERRRMQSINAGFQSLRTLLPRHEGEKLSKAAILQQTAEYIYSLEQEKTRLLSQNCQLKRLLNQQEGNEIPIKKRKGDSVNSSLPDNAEESGGNNSPEPVAILSVTSVSTPKQLTSEVNELRISLDRERRLRMLLEDQIRNCENQIYSENIRDFSQQMTLQYEECAETETAETVVHEAVVDGEHRDPLQIVAVESLPSVAEHRTVGGSRSPSPHLPPLLEAAIKAEPKVEVEVLPEARSPSSPSRLYLANTSRQNLETIVEAIRHLEGDHLFGEEPGQQELPLALTNKPDAKRRLLQAGVEPFLRFDGAQRRQARPGVIVVKHS